ncbi:MAG: SIMPL domain-containing protein [Pelagimonas sp.]|nr:SIMPL domain-containing protein [Pelagimonas sp.]
MFVQRLRSRPTLPVLAMALGLTALPALAETPAQLTVSGVGQVVATPDMARLTLGVEQRDTDPVAAMNAVSEAITRITGVLEAQDVAPRDIQTSALRLDYRLPHSASGALSKPPEPEFFAANMLDLRLRDMDRLGAVLQALLEAGVTDIRGLSFDVEDRKSLQDEALRLAVKDARAKAELMAEAAGVSLGAVLSMSDSASPITPQFAAPRMMMADAESLPISGGEIDLSGQVTIVFSIEPGAAED